MRLLDLFCGAGGAAMGYHQAGFTDIIGVDNVPQPNYPFTFIQADALEPPVDLEGFDLIHASPPCQAYASLAGDGHPDLLPATRVLVADVPHVIENIETAPIRHDIRLCGSMFNLGVRRHRWFELSFAALAPPCQHQGHDIRGYYGRNYGPALVSKDAIQRKGHKPLFRGTVEQAPEDMGIDWMEWDSLREAIPPAYTKFIGEQFLAQ